ncbi:hypothetical protein F4808DRAFT_257743 [Astrocystis sublimbata]|nr:hypothetical protein F4808DRAFT_257743 [Astrocystis sublimbata]
MHVPCRDMGVRQEIFNSGREYQHSSRHRGVHRSRSDPRASDVNSPLYDFVLYPDRKHRSSQMVDRASCRNRQDCSEWCRCSTPQRSVSSTDSASIDFRRRRGGTGDDYDESSQLPKSRVEAPRHQMSSSQVRRESSSAPNSQIERQKTVKFKDEACQEAVVSSRYLSSTGYRRDALTRQSNGRMPRGPSDGEEASEFQDCGGYRNAPPITSRPRERQRGYVPAAPVIPRLPTPDVDSTSDYDSDSARYGFCSCCTLDGRDDHNGERWIKEKTKMDKQVDEARAYISRVRISERLITER